MASAGQTLHDYTDGKYSLGSQDLNLNFGEKVAYAAENYLTKDVRTEDNTVYENYKRADRVAAVMSLAISNASDVSEVSAYEKATSGANRDYLDTIGYTNFSQSDGGFSSKSFQYTDSSGKIQTMTPNQPLSPSQMKDLSINGKCTINGCVCTVEGMSRTDAMNQARAVTAINDRTARFQGHMSSKDKRIEANDMRKSSLEYIKTASGPNSTLSKYIGNGSATEIRNTRRALERERASILDNLSKNPKDSKLLSNLAAKNNEISLLDKHDSVFGGNDHARGGGLTSRQHYGLSTVSSYVMGSDMSLAYRTYRTEATIVTQATRIAYRATAKVAGYGSRSALTLANKVAPNSRFTRGINHLDNSLKSRRDARDTYRQLRASGNKRAANAFRTSNRNAQKNARIVRKESKLELKLNKQLANGKTKRAQITNARLKANKWKQNRNKAISKVTSFLSKPFAFIGKLGRGIWNISPFGLASKFYKKFINPIRMGIQTVINIVKKFLVKYLAIPIAIFLLYVIYVNLICDIVMICGAFFVSDDQDNSNYIQKIVDDISSDLSSDYLKIAKKDAAEHYSSLDNAPKSGYAKSGAFTGTTINGGEAINWYKAATEGSIGDITNWDGTKQLNSLNANLLPITSLMHYRFSTVIDKTNYLNARGYMYYMYIFSHDIQGYDYKDIDDCAPENIYAEPITVANWDIDKKEVYRPKELCSNVYLHGYDTLTASTKLNEIALSMGKACYKIAKAVGVPSFTTLVDETMGQTMGIWVNTKPYDTIDGVDVECHNYVATVYSVTEYELPGADHGWYSELLCGQRPHIHDASCYELICDEKDTPCTMPGDCDAKEGEPGWHICNDSKHTHKDGPPPDYQCLDDGDYNECWKLTCNIPAHDHTAWFEPYTDADGNYHESCYKTVYICKGHCGGHIQPVINLKVDTDWDSLMRKDTLTMPRRLKESDFSDDLFGLIFKASGNLSAYQTEWENKTKAWFTISARDATASEKDVNGFHGWINKKTGTTDAMVAELSDLYGTEDTQFKEGVKNWEEIGGVVFPLGSGKPLSQMEIDSYMEELLAANPGLSDSRQAAIRKAMEYVGMFWYDLQNPATMMAESGRIDCSGFISSVLYHADIGFANDWTASGYSSAGIPRPSSMVAGDILSKNLNSYAGAWTGDGSSNHVIMYIGHLSDGPDGDGEYIIDCSSSQGGSCLRKMSDFGGYKYCYRGCY